MSRLLTNHEQLIQELLAVSDIVPVRWIRHFMNSSLSASEYIHSNLFYSNKIHSAIEHFNLQHLI